MNLNDINIQFAKEYTWYNVFWIVFVRKSKKKKKIEISTTQNVFKQCKKKKVEKGIKMDCCKQEKKMILEKGFLLQYTKKYLYKLLYNFIY